MNAIQQLADEYASKHAWTEDDGSSSHYELKQAFIAGVKSATPLMLAAIEALKAMLWIPVEKEMPKPGIPVLAFKHTKEDRGFRMRACWIPEKFMEDNGDFSGDCNYDEESDQYYWPQGWYEWNEEEETHWMVSGIMYWMPLPDNPFKSKIGSLIEKLNHLDL